MGVGFKLRAGIAALCAALATSAHAETLTEALISAYRHNPQLNSARAGLRALDETVPQALSGWRPTINAQGDLKHQWQDSNFAFQPGGTSSQGNLADLSISLNQPLFRGFKTVEGTKAAEAGVKAGRQQLLGVEQQVLFSAVKAYLDVQRDRRILSLRQRNVSVLQQQARATNERFKAGELTRTDVSQANASVAGAQAALALAQSNLKTSEANYVQFVGHSPGALAAAPKAKGPTSLERSYAIAQETNPNVLAAAQTEDQSEHTVAVRFGDLLPQASLQGTYSLQYNLTPDANTGSFFNPVTEHSRQATIAGVVQVPIYEGGLIYSQVRQAKQTVSQNKLKVIEAVREVRQGVASAWASYIAAGQAVTSNHQQVAASQLALSGVRQEYAVGSRSTIDVLNAEQTLVSAQISEVSAQHDLILGSYQLQSALGHLTARHLHLGAVYDPAINYNSVRNKWIGTEADTLQ